MSKQIVIIKYLWQRATGLSHSPDTALVANLFSLGAALPEGDDGAAGSDSRSQSSDFLRKSSPHLQEEEREDLQERCRAREEAVAPCFGR